MALLQWPGKTAATPKAKRPSSAVDGGYNSEELDDSSFDMELTTVNAHDSGSSLPTSDDYPSPAFKRFRIFMTHGVGMRH
jgi:hypothetical protein